MLFLLLLLNFNYIVSIFADDIKIQRILNTDTVNLCIAQDRDGLLWVGTEGKGLLCYDGNEIKKIKIGEDKNSFQMVPSIFVDSKGIIWAFIQDQGLLSYDKNSGLFERYKSETGNSNSLTSNKAYWSAGRLIIAEDREGVIWVGTANGLNSYDKNTKKFTQYKNISDDTNSLSNNNVLAVFVDKKGLVWIGTEDGLNYYDKSTGKFHRYKHDSNNSNSLSNNSANTIKEDSKGFLWIGTKEGLCSFDKQQKIFTTYKHDTNDLNSLSCDEVNLITVDRFDNLWICSEGGVGIDKYDTKTKTFTNYKYNPKDIYSISSNEVLCSFEDNSGIIWLVDASGGINKCTLRKDIFKSYSYNPEDHFSLISNNLARLHEDKKRNIWIGAFKSGLCLYAPNDKFEKFGHISKDPSSLPSNTVYAITDAPNNKLWIGNYGDFISLFDPETKQVIKTFKDPYQTDTPCNLIVDNKRPELLWFASFCTGGLFNLNTITGEFFQYKHNPADISSVSNENTIDILQDENVLWVGSGGNGLTNFDKITGKCTHYKHNPNDKNSISGNVVVQSYIDSKGSFWVTTDDGGLNKFDRQTGNFTHYGTDCGFPSNSTRHILEDNDGYLWISTNSGIVKFNPKTSKVVKQFTATDGLPSNQFDKCANPLKDSNGNFWFSTLKGVCKFKPEEASKMESNPHIPPIILSSFKSKEGTYNESGLKKLTEARLLWPDNSFEFTFSALDYTDPEKNQYAYKLEGFDKDWKYIGTNRFGQYSNLNPGEYTLRLKGTNNDGIWNEEGISIKITITPPFWMTSWFKGLIGIVILSIIGGIVHLRVRSLKEKAIYMKNCAIAEVTAQVAHDIRSPLAALSTALKELKELPEQKRILIRNATRRISDIANNLLARYKVKENESVLEDASQKNVKAELISSLLDSLISEKRAQISEKSIDIVLELGDNTHSCFVNLGSEKFKRMISNLINNAYEAIETKGAIRVVLTKQYNDLIIEIIDNGRGIAEDILPKIKQGGISSKKSGFGLGISSAIQNIKSWNGNYDIQSKEGGGTTFTIRLPIAEEPDWFQCGITLSPHKHIIVLDDDESIHNIWQARFLEYVEYKTVTLEHFYEPLAFMRYCKTSRSEYDLFLVDYELVNSKETGLDLIEQLDLKKQVILVTSRYEEPEIRERIRELGIKIIPKSFAPYVPISIVNEFVQEEQPELIFIDDDKNLTEAWKLQASCVKKKIATFNHSEDFKKVMNNYNKDILVYIDSDLKEKIPGEIFAKFLYEEGFRHLCLATGYEKDRFGYMPWIKDIVSKEAPF